MEEKLRNLEQKKAILFSNIEMLSSVSVSMYIDFGRVCSEIMMLKKQINREVKNIFDEN
jgi:hypothetical protein